MAMCAICGSDDGRYRGRWWDSDDGWRFGGLCDYCAESALKDRPAPDDFAWDKRGTLDVDAALAECDEL